MATLTRLQADGVLTLIDPVLEPGELPVRLMYASTQVIEYLRDTLPMLESTIAELDFPPIEQVDALIARFTRGDALEVGRVFHVMRPSQKGVWELKTADIRVFGWFVSLDCFVAVSMQQKDHVILHELESGLREEVVSFRERVMGEDLTVVYGGPDAVVSNCA